MRILGIDPGLATIGLGLIEAPSRDRMAASEWLTIETHAALPLPERLQEIHRDLEEFLLEAKPDLAVVERQFFASNATTAMDVAHARGVVLLTLAECAVPLIEPTPMQLKLGIAGDGRADKRQMQAMVARMLGLAAAPQPDDAADALALAVYGALQHHATVS